MRHRLFETKEFRLIRAYCSSEDNSLEATDYGGGEEKREKRGQERNGASAPARNNADKLRRPSVQEPTEDFEATILMKSLARRERPRRPLILPRANRRQLFDSASGK